MKQGDVWWLQHCVRIWIYGEEDKPVEIKWKYAAVRAKDTSCCNECQANAEGTEFVYMQLFALALIFFLLTLMDKDTGLRFWSGWMPIFCCFLFLHLTVEKKKAPIICQHEKIWPLVKFIKDRLTSTALQPFPSIHTEKAQEAETLFAWAKSCTL